MGIGALTGVRMTLLSAEGHGVRASEASELPPSEEFIRSPGVGVEAGAEAGAEGVVVLIVPYVSCRKYFL